MNILITGVAGSGKSTLARELKSQGYLAYDTDSIKDLSAWVDIATGKPNHNFERNSAKDWVDRYDWQWDEKALRKLLNKSGTGNTYFCGSSGNQHRFYSLFDKVFLLEMDDQLLRHRLLHTPREHDYGKRPGELDVISEYYEDFQDQAKAGGAMVISAKKSVSEVIQSIISEVEVQSI